MDRYCGGTVIGSVDLEPGSMCKRIYCPAVYRTLDLDWLGILGGDGLLEFHVSFCIEKVPLWVALSPELPRDRVSPSG
jgi:hypothetical protein